MYKFCNRRLIRYLDSSQRPFNYSYSTERNKKNVKLILPKRLQGSEQTMWDEYAALSEKYESLDLGVCCPDYNPPENVTNSLLEVLQENSSCTHQCTPARGHPQLIKSLTEFYGRLTGRKICSDEMLVTVGASEAIFAAILGHVQERDEVIVIEPFINLYERSVRMAGGTIRSCPLTMCRKTNPTTSADFKLDMRRLKKLFNKKTKMIILNTPHNPSGKVFSHNELQKIAQFCHRYNVICLSDEVYEWLVYDGKKHIRMCTLPGMWERTITVSSACKTFMVAGWRVGWAYGPQELLRNLQLVHEVAVRSCPTCVQEAMACVLKRECCQLKKSESYLNTFNCDMSQKRDTLVGILQNVGLCPIKNEAGDFTMANIECAASKIDLSEECDKYLSNRFSKWMIKNIDIFAMPCTAFYTEPHKKHGEKYVRFCFMKKDETLTKACEALTKLKQCGQRK